MPKGATLSHDGTRFYVTNFGQLDTKNVTIYDAHTLAHRRPARRAGHHLSRARSRSTARRSSSRTSRRKLGHVRRPRVEEGDARDQDGHAPEGPRRLARRQERLRRELDVASPSRRSTSRPARSSARSTSASSRAAWRCRRAASSTSRTSTATRSTSSRARTSRRSTAFAVCKCPRHLALSPDDKTLYISCLNFSQLHAMDVASETVDPPRADRHRAEEHRRLEATADTCTLQITARAAASRSSTRTTGRRASSRSRASTAAAASPSTPDGKHALVTGWYDRPRLPRRLRRLRGSPGGVEEEDAPLAGPTRSTKTAATARRSRGRSRFRRCPCRCCRRTLRHFRPTSFRPPRASRRR